MTTPPTHALEARMSVIQQRWNAYLSEGRLEQFIEFTIAVNSLTEQLNRLRMPGLSRLSAGLENAALDKLEPQHDYPLAVADVEVMQRQLEALSSAISALHPPLAEQRSNASKQELLEPVWIKQRAVWIISAPQKHNMAEALANQLGFFGFTTTQLDWETRITDDDMPLAVLFIPTEDHFGDDEFTCITHIRGVCPTSQLIYLGERESIEPIVALMRIGIDVIIPFEEQPSGVLNCILNLVQGSEQEKSRVLIVEDSRVATTMIVRTLSEHGIDSLAIHDPGELLGVLASYRPDLILMDMHMPRFNGIEATRVLRQMSEYSSLPIVYVSAESEVGLQVEALRLGGDQFLIKPFNPVLLAAVVKTKIERHRESLRSTRTDGLTNLLNHSAVKSGLKSKVEQITTLEKLTVVMIDIDHFKSVNDTYGHPVGDQVIRSLAWLLKGHLRANDLIGRYGGEEFLVALPGLDPAQAEQVIDRIRKDFAALPHAHADGALYCTFSAGIAAYDHGTAKDTAESLTDLADQALLKAKRNGRNQVISTKPT